MRPKKYIDAKIVREKASRGLTLKQIADYFHITDRTLRNRFNEDQEIKSAYEQGLAEGIELVSNKLFELALDGNLQAIQFFLRSRAGWNDRADKSQSDDDEPKEAPERLVFVQSVEEYETKYKDDGKGTFDRIFINDLQD